MFKYNWIGSNTIMLKTVPISGCLSFLLYNVPHVNNYPGNWRNHQIKRFVVTILVNKVNAFSVTRGGLKSIKGRSFNNSL